MLSSSLTIFLIEFLYKIGIFDPWYDVENYGIYRNIDVKYKINQLYDSDEEFIWYKRDQYGFRGNYKNVSDIDIVTIGGSTTDQRYISYNKTYQSVLEKSLKQSGINVSIVNAGIDGHTIKGHIFSLEKWFSLIEGIKPKLIIFYIGINDTYRYFKGSELKKKTFPRNTLMYGLLHKNYHKYLNQYFDESKVGHARLDFKKLSLIENENINLNEEKLNNYLINYEIELDDLLRVCMNYTENILLVTQPSNYCTIIRGKKYYYDHKQKISGSSFEHVHDKINCTIKKQADKCYVLEIEKSNFKTEDFYDFVHTNPKGSKKIGNIISNYISLNLDHLFPEK